MIIDRYALTREGRRHRVNEDAFLLCGLEGEEPLVDALWHGPTEGPMGFLAAVADGLGSGLSGEIASREGLAAFAVGLFGHWGRMPGGEATEEGLLHALRASALGANEAVLQSADEDPLARGMSTTLLAVVVWQTQAHLCRVGDGRAWLLRHREVSALTPEAPVAHMPCLGSLRPLEPELVSFPLRRGDRLLLGTDGLHRQVPEGEIARILNLGQSLRRTTERLVEAALEGDGGDDVTALLLGFDDLILPLPRADERGGRVNVPKGGAVGLVRRLWKTLRGAE